MNNNLLKQLQQELFAVKNQLINKKFLVKSTDGNYVEIKHYNIAELSIEGEFYVHRPLSGKGYVVSEATTGLKIAEGANEGIAIGKARHMVKTFVEANGIEALKAMLDKSRPATVEPKVEPIVEVKPIAEPIIVAHEEEQPNTIEQALGKSLDYKNCIDVDYISEEISIPSEEVEQILLSKNLAFINPETNELETPEEYLSGNVRAKLVVAEYALKQDPKFERNYEELKKVIPENIPSDLIQYSLGAAWIPLHVFEKFANNMFKAQIRVQYMRATGKFCATCKGIRTIQIRNTYGAGGKDGLEILNATLNNQQIVITEINSQKKSVKNLEKTSMAQSMQEQMQDEFIAFIRVNKEIEEETERLYNETMNSYVELKSKTPTITHYPNASQHIKLMIHQKTGVAWNVKESGCIADEVGLGKSILCITTAMEMRRLDIAKKIIIVVQNKTRGQFISTFRELYPNANILAPTKEELTTNGRADLYERIAYEDFDAVILPQSQFDLIPDDTQRQRDILEMQLLEADDMITRIDKKSAPFEHAQARRTARTIEKELSKVSEEENRRNETHELLKNTDGYKRVLNFEEMNVDALLIDEFHRYKRLGVISSMASNGIKGIDTAKSARAQSCLLKLRWVQNNNKGKNTVGYTGTPISNTMAEAWTMIRFFRPDILLEMGIDHFDQFAKTFGQVVPSLEMTGGGTFKISNRFAKFQNLPEFVKAFKRCVRVTYKEDVPEFKENDTLPQMFDGKIQQVIVKQSDELRIQIKEFRDLLEWYDELEGVEKREKRWIPLVIFNKAKQAAIDLRLLDPTKMDSPQSKVNQVIRKAFAIYKETNQVQMIFCDLYQSPEPKSEWLDEDCTIPNPAFGVARFNLFNDIKIKLISMGVRPSEIAILTEPKYDKIEKAEQLFEDTNAGRIKILLGTTERMGVGVNAQQKLIALHHIDAPLRPMDFSQRNGRIIRQGNENKFVWIFTYGVEKTLDSAAFQRLAIKQKFINQIMKGENLERVMDDAADDALVTFEEMIAILSDSPYAQQKLLLDNKLKSERLKRDNFHSRQVQTQRQLNNALETIRALELKLESQNKWYTETNQFFPDGIVTEVEINGIKHIEHFSTATDEYVDSIMFLWENSVNKIAQGHIFINGAKVLLRIINSQRYSKKIKEMYDFPLLTYTIPEIGVLENYYGNGVSIDSNSGSGMMHSIRWKIEDAIKNPLSTQREIDKIILAVTELEKNMDNVFDETKLFDLEGEIELIKQKMLEEKLKPEVEQ